MQDRDRYYPLFLNRNAARRLYQHRRETPTAPRPVLPGV